MSGEADKFHRQRRKLRVNRIAYESWLGDRGEALGEHIDLLKPSIRNSVLLCLLDRQGEPTGYGDILRELRKHKVFDGCTVFQNLSEKSKVDSLRLAVSELTARLRLARSPYQLKGLKAGKSTRHYLQPVRQNDRNARFERFRKGSEAPRFGDLKEIARSILNEGQLQFAHVYSTYTAAAKWLTYSNEYSYIKRDYEADAFFAYGFDERLANGADSIGIVALGPGEGLGEVELLERVLRSEKLRHVRIKYLAVDTSDFLLQAHSSLVHERLREHCSSGRLTYTHILGDAYRLVESIANVRATLGPAFLKDMPIVCTFFGNCLGNAENVEQAYFGSIRDAFKEAPWVATLVGVSLRRKDEDGIELTEKYRFDPFFLEVPRHLLHDLEILESLDEQGNKLPKGKSDEFVLTPQDLEGYGYALATPYMTPTGIQGTSYRVHYELRHNLRVAGESEIYRRGNRILLYSVIKYEMESLAKTLRDRGWEVDAPPSHLDELRIKVEGQEKFRYAVFSAARKRGGV